MWSGHSDLTTFGQLFRGHHCCSKSSVSITVIKQRKVKEQHGMSDYISTKVLVVVFTEESCMSTNPQPSFSTIRRAKD